MNKYLIQGILSLSIVCTALCCGCSGPSEITVTGIKNPVEETASQEFILGDADMGDVAAQDGASEDVISQSGGSVDAGMQDGNHPECGSAGTEKSVVVYVCGAVERPGVCELPAGSRLFDALSECGGFREDADTEWLNLARVLTDGEMVVFYTMEETGRMREEGAERGQAQVSGAGIAADGSLVSGAENTSDASQQSGAGNTSDPSGASAGSGNVGTGASKVNLNTASKEELMTLPGIGESKADAIIRYRTEQGLFASPEDVMNISGIKDSVFGKIKDLVSV